MGHSKNALGSYLQFSGSATSLTKKRKSSWPTVSQLNGCKYCQAAHTAGRKWMDLQTIKLLRLEKEALAGIIKLMF
jgi:alkylhydroperoxidase family enzyme